MQVQGPGGQQGLAGVAQGRPAAARRDESTLPAPNAARNTDETAPAEAKLRPAKGVLRLLQEGHFKGVADVRLRINFADEIAALQSTATSKGVVGGDDPIIDAVSGVLDEFLSQEGIEEEIAEQIRNAASAFEEAVRKLFTDFDGAKDPKGSTLLEALGSAFENFLKALQDLIPAPDVEEAAAEPTPLEATLEEATAVAETGPDFAQLVEDLQTAFDEALKTLQEQLEEAQVLPPLSPPTGNGGAYEKFLAILNGLSGEGTSSGGVDTAA